MKPLIVLAVGALGGGKDTAIERLKEWGIVSVHAKFARRLKQVVSVLFSIPPEYMDNRSAKDFVHPMAPNHTIGQLLQIVGTDWVRTINPAFWCMSLLEEIRQDGDIPVPNTGVSDCRFLNEASFFMDDDRFETRILYLTREGADTRDPNHPSELGRFDVLQKYGMDDRFVAIPNHDMSKEQLFDAIDTLVVTGFFDVKSSN